MDITVKKAEGLPEQAYIAVRAGEVRKQVQYKPGETCHFDLRTSQRTFMIDIFEKIGTKQVSLLDLVDAALTQTEEGPGLWKTVEITGCRGMPMTLDMHVNVASDEAIPALSPNPDRRQARRQAAVEAKSYLDLQGVQKLLQNMVHKLLHLKPVDTTAFMIGYLQDHQSRQDGQELPTAPTPATAKIDTEDEMPDWSAVPGIPLDMKSEENTPQLDAFVANLDQHERPGEVVGQEGAGAVIGKNVDGDSPDSECPEEMPDCSSSNRSPSPEEDVFANVPGLGNDDFPGFPADACPSELPDLEEHCSLAANVLKEDGAVYASLKELRTTSGTSLARCIKPAMDNTGHPLLPTIGAFAGDAECYDLFDALFAPIIRQRQPSWQPNSVGGGAGSAALEPGDVKPAALDPSGAHVTSVQVCAQRNLFKFHMPPAMTREERREVERLIVDALASSGGELQGTYLPLAGSNSFPSKPGGMSAEEEEELESNGILFEEPDAAFVLSSGAGKNWPHARGVYVSHERSLAVWVNEEDHVKLISRLPSSDLGAAFHRLCSAEAALINSLKERAHTFAWNERLGFLTSCPSNLGTGVLAEVHVRLPLLSRQSGFQALCKRFGVRATGPRVDGWSISNEERLGSSAFAQINRVADAVRELLVLEARLTEGEDIDLLAMVETTTAVSEK